MTKIPQAQCNHILGINEGLAFTTRASDCLPPDGLQSNFSKMTFGYAHCPLCGCLNLSQTILDELWKRHDEAREADEAERKRLLTWPI